MEELPRYSFGHFNMQEFITKYCGLMTVEHKWKLTSLLILHTLDNASTYFLYSQVVNKLI